MLLKLHAVRLIKPVTLKSFVDENVNRSFSRDVITFQNLKLKIHQSFYPHQAKEAAYLYLFTTDPSPKWRTEIQTS